MNSIGTYYGKELSDWNEMLRIYQDDALEFEQRLLEVMSRNGKPDLAANTEDLLNQLSRMQDNFFRLGHEIGEQEKNITQKGVSIDNSSITDAMIVRQAALRKEMQVAERKFIELKYACYELFSGMLTHK